MRASAIALTRHDAVQHEAQGRAGYDTPEILRRSKRAQILSMMPDLGSLALQQKRLVDLWIRPTPGNRAQIVAGSHRHDRRARRPVSVCFAGYPMHFAVSR